MLVKLPSPRLREGIAFVDTPGVGSLALAGGAETVAYLPRCDLGVVLVVAVTTLNHEDLALEVDTTAARQVLDEADEAIRRARERSLDWWESRRNLAEGLPGSSPRRWCWRKARRVRLTLPE
jgi:hypothetical protein